MSKLNWTLDQLKQELKGRSTVKGWILTRENVQRRERYFMMDGRAMVIDQDREVHAQNIHARIMVTLPGKPGRQGEIAKKLFPAMPLAPQIDSAIESALQTDHQAWELPASVPSDLPQLKTADPRMAEDLEGCVGEITRKIEKSVVQPRDTAFNSAELFMSVHHTEAHLSNGLVHRSSQSRIYSEAAYSYARNGAQGGTQSDEYMTTLWSVSMDDMPVEKLFDETSLRARHSLDTVKPQTGRYSVIVDAEVLAMLFHNQLGQLSSNNSYHGLPFIKPGDELVPGNTEAGGDAINITLDPLMEFGGDTVAVSEQGIAQGILKLVDRNRVVATSTDKRYSDYLGTPPTTTRGNIVVDPGKLSYSDLTKASSLVLEILQFSGLFADPNTGTYSSEIRLAKLYDNATGKVTYIKGGSLSGSFKEDFRGVRFCKERIKRAHFSSSGGTGEGYFGPTHALLSNVSIVG